MTAILRLAREMATGLAAAHDKGLVHRDIKPANIWLESPKGRVKILDFGLARPAEADREDVERLTHDGMVMGTPAYMSPEQARGVAVDFRTDLFSLGVVLYRLCTGQLPFTGPTTTAVLTELAISIPTPAADLNPQVPIALSDLIDKLLEKDPVERPKSAREVADTLRQMDVTSTRPALSKMATRPMIRSEADDDTEKVSQPIRPRRRRKRKQRFTADWLMGVGAVVALVALAVGVPLAIYKAIPPRKAVDSKPAEATPAIALPATPTSATNASPPAEQPPVRSTPMPRPEPPSDRQPPPPPPEPPHRPGEGPPPGFPPPPGRPGGPPPGLRPGP
jgi:serine/threonine protein kinase